MDLQKNIHENMIHINTDYLTVNLLFITANLECYNRTILVQLLKYACHISTIWAQVWKHGC